MYFLKISQETTDIPLWIKMHREFPNFHEAPKNENIQYVKKYHSTLRILIPSERNSVCEDWLESS